MVYAHSESVQYSSINVYESKKKANVFLKLSKIKFNAVF